MSKGRLITLVGADGSGKSTVARQLEARLARPVTYVYMGSNPSAATHALPTTRAWIALKRALGREVHHSGPPTPGGRRRPARWTTRAAAHIKSLARLGPLVAEELYRFVVAGIARRRGRVVVADRHPVVDHLAADAAAARGEGGWRRLGDRLHAVLRRAFPGPGTIVHLDAPAAVLFARKPEGTLAALEARCAEYRALADLYPDVVRVDASRPLDGVLDEVARVVSRPAEARRRPGWLARRAADVRTKVYYRALDAAHTSDVRPGEAAGPHLRRAAQLRSSNFDRVGSLSRAARLVAPRLAGRLERALWRTDALPLRSRQLEPVAYGTAATCYRMDPDNGFVLKTFRESFGQPHEHLMSVARRVQGNYETLLRWYADVPHLLPRTAHVIMQGPLRGAPTAAQLQEIVEGELTDLLRDHDDAELALLLAADPRFRALFAAFARGTRRAWDEERRCLDMLGTQNLMLLRRPAGLELRVVDMGIVDLEQRARTVPTWCDEMAAILERLERLAARAAEESVSA